VNWLKGIVTMLKRMFNGGSGSGQMQPPEIEVERQLATDRRKEIKELRDKRTETMRAHARVMTRKYNIK